MTSKIELYNPAGTLIYTLTNSALSIHTKDVLANMGIGSCNFTLPANLENFAMYSDVDVNWKAKIYIGYSQTLSASDLLFTGKIKKATSPVSTQTGYVRVFEARCISEVLERRFKTNKCWQGVAAHTVVDEVAADLGLGTGSIGAEAAAVYQTVKTESYLELLKKVSDYWVNSGSQVKKDFYVDGSDNLVWGSRPLRSAGVESFTVGQDIISYQLIRDGLPIKNSITVYGAAAQPYPTDRDTFTEALSGTGWSWTANDGTVALESAAPKVGTYDIQGYTGVSDDAIDLTLSLPVELTIRDINQLCFWEVATATATAAAVKILAPDDSNYFEYNMGDPNATWNFRQLSLGPTNEYSAASNPNGTWTKTGSPNWWTMKGLRFYYYSSAGNDWYCSIDGLYFMPTRYSHTEPDATSIASYGQCDAEFTDDTLLSNFDCESRANTLLYQLKDPVKRLDLSVLGNSNLKKGDRLTVTLPNEGVTAESFDVVSVENDLNSSGWITTAALVDTANTRVLPPATFYDAALQNFGKLKEVTSELYLSAIR